MYKITTDKLYICIVHQYMVYSISMFTGIYNMCAYVYIYIFMYVCMYKYIYIHKENTYVNIQLFHRGWHRITWK